MANDNTLNLDQLAAHLRANRFGIHDLLKDKPITLTYDDLRRICHSCATTAVHQALRLAPNEYGLESKHLHDHGMTSNKIDSELQHIVTWHLKSAADWKRNSTDEDQL